MKQEDRIGKLIEQLKQVEPRTRLNLLVGGMLATADELRIGGAQIEAIVRTALAERASILARMRAGETLVLGPNGLPLPPASSAVPDSSPTTKVGGERTVLLAAMNAKGRPPTSACECAEWPCPCACHKPGFRHEEPHMAGVAFPATECVEAAPAGDPGPLCVFCKKSEAEGRHRQTVAPSTWHSFRASEPANV